MTASLFTAALVLTSALVSQAKQQNIIAIVTDDQSAWSLSCYGGKNLDTPRLDRLASQGARFTSAFVNSPVCSPSRFSYLTGRWPSESGITDWLTASQSKRIGLSKQFPSWPTILRQHGYRTALVGKWHLGTAKAYRPQANGINAFQGNLSGGWHPKNPTFVNQDSQSEKIEGDSVKIVTDLAIAQLSAKSDQPFALLIHYREPHAPYVPMPDEDMVATRDMQPDIPKYPGLKKNLTKRLTREYLTAVRALDRNIGRLLDALESRGLADNTMVNDANDSMRSIRTAEWKLIRHYLSKNSDELYDLKNDPEESTNLYADSKHRNTRDTLQLRLEQWMTSIADNPTAQSPQKRPKP